MPQPMIKRLRLGLATKPLEDPQHMFWEGRAVEQDGKRGSKEREL